MKKWSMMFIVGLLILLTACGNSSDSSNGGKSDGDSNAQTSTLDRLKKEGKVKLGVANEKPYGYKT
ncbi:ectoine/hydroxyectoine ABC transporter substrate-binding protein EhuB, partial [Bacillus sp. Sa1BUA2]|nr:ectoine/hydroxyectoine ABC transporter substrate-binding protein EhuB [Bacillus norwichensis]